MRKKWGVLAVHWRGSQEPGYWPNGEMLSKRSGIDVDFHENYYLLVGVSARMNQISNKIARATSVFSMMLVTVLMPTSAFGQFMDVAQISFVAEDESLVTIHGRSSVGPFRCDAQEVTGNGRGGWSNEVTEEPFVEASLTAIVGSFDCQNGKMSRDLRKALREDTNPVVVFTVNDGYARPAKVDETGEFILRASGQMNIAGVEKPVDIHLTAVREGFMSFRLTGTHDIKMTDFQIDPPTALLGLIKADENITIEFNLLLSPDLGF